MSTTLTTDLRHGDLPMLVEHLKALKDPRLDAVVPAQTLTSRGGVIHVAGLSAMGDDVKLTPTEDADAMIGDKLGIGTLYTRKLREKALDLYDANVNGWLHGTGGDGVEPCENDPAYATYRRPDGRKFFVRSYVTPGETEGKLRALFSDKYGIVDNYDAIMAVLAGINQSGETVEVVEANVTERQMSVSFAAPNVRALAPKLLANYRPPEGVRSMRGQFDIAVGDEPVVFAGFRLRNSETGFRKLNLTPEVRVRVCSNGMTMNLLGNAFERTHLGVRMGEGVVDWSQETMRRQLAVITSQATDAVRAFLNEETLMKAVGYVEERADRAIADPAAAVEVVAKRFGFSDEESATILRHFTLGGQSTAGGMLNAITSAAQVVDSADRAEHLNDNAVAALALVAS